MTEPLETDRFRLRTSQFFTRLVYLHGTLPIATVLVLLLVAVVFAFALDYRFAIVALMVVFLIAPLAMAWLYLNCGFHADASFNVSWHTLSVGPDAIEITLLKPIYGKVEEDEEEHEPVERIVGWSKGKTLRYDSGMLRPYLTGGDGITVPLSGGKGFIAVPRSAFGDDESYKNFVDRIGALCLSGPEATVEL